MLDVTIGIPLIIAVAELAKRTGLNIKYVPIFAVMFGMAAFYLFGLGETLPRLLEGLIAGLSAVGLYSGIKTTTK